MDAEEKALLAERAAANKALNEEIAAKNQREWEAYCKKPLKVGQVVVNSRGDLYRVMALLVKPNPKEQGSGKYRVEYVGEDDALRPCLLPMPRGEFEAIGGPAAKDMRRG